MPEESRCEYQVFKPKYGLAIRGLHITGGMGIALSAMFLAVERTIATVNYITYEKEGRKLLGITFVITEIIISLGTMFYVRTPKQFYPYCAPELYNSRAAKLFGNILYGLNIAALITFTLLWIVNKQRGGILINIHLRILSTRYQLKENISTTLLMIPVMLVVTLMTTSSQLVYHLYMPEYDENTVITRNVLKELIIYAPYAEYQISLMPVLTLMMIILLPYFHKHIKRSFLRIASLNFYLPGTPNTIDIITVDEARELYFEKLRGQWRAKTSAMDLK